MKTCTICNMPNTSSYKSLCGNCYTKEKRYAPVIAPPCERCGRARLKKWDCRGKLCNTCYVKDYKEKNPSYSEKHKKLCRDYQRKLRGIDTNLPLLVAPAGSGSIKKGQGYRVICKKEFRGMPHADKKGRIAEHTYVMMQKLCRPLRKGETVHHINGIKDDNRLENLELWSSSHPSGQRVEDKIKWCKEFLLLYESLPYGED